MTSSGRLSDPIDKMERCAELQHPVVVNCDCAHFCFSFLGWEKIEITERKNASVIDCGIVIDVGNRLGSLPPVCLRQFLLKLSCKKREKKF